MNIDKQITKYISSILGTKHSINHNEIAKLVFLIKNSGGNIFMGGIGKNGLVSKICASTLLSMGIKCFYINPVDAIHGDLGAIVEGDLLIVISKSGNTEELLSFLKYAKEKTENIYLIHSNNNCLAKEYSKYDLHIDLSEELDDYKTIPTISVLTYIMIMQIVGYLVYEQNNQSIEGFLKNHPGGSIGKIQW